MSDATDNRFYREKEQHSSKTDLLPCPFCGGEASYENVPLDRAVDEHRWGVGCRHEECIGFQWMKTYARKCEAAAEWNKRAPSPTQQHIAVIANKTEFSAEDRIEIIQKMLAGVSTDEPPASNPRPTMLWRVQKLLEQMRRGETPFIGVGFMQELEVALRAADEPSAALRDIAAKVIETCRAVDGHANDVLVSRELMGKLVHAWEHPCSPQPPSAALALVRKQAEDDGLWFQAATAPEAYLQQELRKLHAAVEGVTETKPAPQLCPNCWKETCEEWCEQARAAVETSEVSVRATPPTGRPPVTHGTPYAIEPGETAAHKPWCDSLRFIAGADVHLACNCRPVETSACNGCKSTPCVCASLCEFCDRTWSRTI